jgi:hypothetical protein
MTYVEEICDGPGPVAKDAVSNYLGEVKLHPALKAYLST